MALEVQENLPLTLQNPKVHALSTSQLLRKLPKPTAISLEILSKPLSVYTFVGKFGALIGCLVNN